LVRAGNDVGGHKAITDTLTGISTSSHGSVHGAGFSAHHDSDVATPDKFAADEADLSSFGHGIGRLNRRHQTAGLDHAQGDALHRALRAP